MSIEDPVVADIRRLEAARAQTRYWTVGSFVAIVLMLAVELIVVIGGVRNLFQPGPVQNQFTSALMTDLNSDVVPTVQSAASQAMTQSQPELENQFKLMSKRLPDVSNAFMTQFQQLQRDIPAQGGKVISDTYGQTLQSAEPKIRQMFPDVTDQNVNQLVENLTTESQTQITSTAQTLFQRHIDALNSVNADLQKIEQTEPVNPDQDKANLEMAIAIVGAFNNDLTNANAGNAQGKSAPAHSKKEKTQ